VALGSTIKAIGDRERMAILARILFRGFGVRRKNSCLE
jgi:hypothetical protein